MREHKYKSTIEIEIIEQIEDDTELNSKEEIDNKIVNTIKNRLEFETGGQVNIDLTYSEVSESEVK